MFSALSLGVSMCYLRERIEFLTSNESCNMSPVRAGSLEGKLVTVCGASGLLSDDMGVVQSGSQIF